MMNAPSWYAAHMRWPNHFNITGRLLSHHIPSHIRLSTSMMLGWW
jgi:hypothetical protein